MLDLMFSCRVQSKRVEHAFVSHIVRKFRTPTAVDFFVSYRRTPKNAPSGKVFDDLGAIQIGEIDGVSDLLFPRGNTVPDDGIVTIDDQKAPSPEYVS